LHQDAASLANMKGGLFGIPESLGVLLKGHRSEAEGLPKGSGDEFPKAKKGHRVPGPAVEGFSKGGFRMLKGFEEELGHILGVDMVERAETPIEEDDFFSVEDFLERLRIVVAEGGYEGFPWAGDVGGADNGELELTLFRSGEEDILNEHLLSSVVVFRKTGSIFRSRNHPGLPVNPGCGAHKQVHVASSEHL